MSPERRSIAIGLSLVALVACSRVEEQEPRQPVQKTPVTQFCGACHRPPAPGAHTKREWPGVVARMQLHMARQGKQPLTAEDKAAVLNYLTRH